MPYNAGSGVSLQRSGSEKSPHIFRPLLPAEYVTVFSGRTDAPDPTTVTLAAHARAEGQQYFDKNTFIHSSDSYIEVLLTKIHSPQRILFTV